MEAHIAGIAGTIGVLISVYLLYDSIADLRVVLLNNINGVIRVMAVSRLIGEITRFMMQLLYLVAVILSLLGGFGRVILLVLVATPILMTIGSIVSFLSKRAVVAVVDKEKVEES